ncbi:unnamed protein product [Periconia digitata]|uniref:Uncharacterized protein n=1 Tax=Periconia digitata TaxID=1303443 RepID=A0A9W4ULZ1_9PLEO|nr:unnamed protein product [Periconia digitata]
MIDYDSLTGWGSPTSTMLPSFYPRLPFAEISFSILFSFFSIPFSFLSDPSTPFPVPSVYRASLRSVGSRWKNARYVHQTLRVPAPTYPINWSISIRTIRFTPRWKSLGSCGTISTAVAIACVSPYTVSLTYHETMMSQRTRIVTRSNTNLGNCSILCKENEWVMGITAASGRKKRKKGN